MRDHFTPLQADHEKLAQWLGWRRCNLYCMQAFSGDSPQVAKDYGVLMQKFSQA